MISDAFVVAVRELALQTNAAAGNSEWFLFGSAKDCICHAKDIDLLVVCKNPEIADSIRRLVDLDRLSRPIHLSILTVAEERETSFVERQFCMRIV